MTGFLSLSMPRFLRHLGLGSSLGLMALFGSLMSGCGGSSPRPQQAPVMEQNVPSQERSVLSPQKVSYAMRGKEEVFRKCFMRSMSSRGIVETRFDIDPQGRVEKVDILRDTLNSSGISDCVSSHLSEMRFDEPRQPVWGRWTFVFRLTDPIDDKERKARLKKAAESTEGDILLLPQSRGSINLDYVDQVVQASYPLYAHCYRDSIQRRGESRGLVRFQLVIDEEGAVDELTDAGSVMPDPFAIDCMAEAFYAMNFPKTEGGIAALKYSLELQ